MGNYKIKVKVEIVECNEKTDETPTGKQDGSFEFNISEGDAISIDRCEQALLRTNYGAVREAISKHLTEVSKKKVLEQRTKGELIVNSHLYQVDGEVGRFTFSTHSIVNGKKTEYNSNRYLFPNLKAKEWYKTSGFNEIGMIYGTVEGSYRKTADLINRIRYQDGATPMRTLRENTETEGAQILDFVGRKTTEILKKNRFTEEGIPEDKSKEYMKETIVISEEKVREAIEESGLLPEEVAEIKKNLLVYESVNETVNISIDDVGTRMQKEKRCKGGKSKGLDGKKYVHNTVAHIHKEEKTYVINGSGMAGVLRIIVGFLINNDLLKYRLQFFADGQKTLQSGILNAFSWFSNIGLILDWYHLEDKCKMQLSMGMNGRDIRNNTLDELRRLLWYGMIDKAITYLRGISDEFIKDKDKIGVLINYIERNRAYIPCYAIRKKLGLRNSSNIGEKMNDIAVSNRQKHNGMSWSKNGSVALATVTVLKINKEHKKWFEKGDLELKLAA
ncbi:MAG: hypothetical protein V1749_06710 [Candidatus Desantisbacteria bacterium]